MGKREQNTRTKEQAIAELLRSLQSADTPADHVQVLRMVRDTADSALTDAVVWCKVEGATWDEMGRWLGVTRQSAHARYVDLEP